MLDTISTLAASASYAAGAAQTLTLALGAGALVLILSGKLRIPAILPLLLTGMLMGPETAGLIDTASLGGGLKGLVTVSICILIFEGTLHLDRQTFARAPRAIRSVLTIGPLVTWGLASIAALYILGLSIEISLLLGAVLIVTGPTVIQPIIRRTRLTPGLQAMLEAEGILIDAIGAITAIAVLDAVLELAAHDQAATTATLGTVILTVLFRLLAGGAIGVACGYLAAQLMKRLSTDKHTNHDHHLHQIAMGACMIAVGFSEMIAEEAGLAAATTCGLVIANTKILGVAQLRRFKEQLAAFFLAILFVLIASDFSFSYITDVTPAQLLFITVLIVIVRPAMMLASTATSSITWPERIFGSLFAPRGIVAAAVASLAALSLRDNPAFADDAMVMQSTIVLVIIVTVLLATLTTKPLAKSLGVLAGTPNALVIVGGHRLGRELASALHELDISLRLIDTNPAHIAAAAGWGIPTQLGDATDARWLEEDAAPADLGWVFSCTGNKNVDQVITRWGAARCGSGHAFRLTDEPDPTLPTKPALTTTRSLMQLLWDMDRSAAAVQTWQGPVPPNTQGVETIVMPFATVKDGTLTLLPADTDLDTIPEDATVVGLVSPPAQATPPQHETPPPPAEPDPTQTQVQPTKPPSELR